MTSITSITFIGAAAITVAALRGGVPDDSADFANVAEGECGRPAVIQPEESPHWSLGHGYTRSGDHILFDGQRIDEAGRDTLESFAAYIGRELELAHDVHAASFVALSPEYSKDRDTVYYRWVSPGRFWVVVIPDADPASFEVMDFDLARDARHVWRTDVVIPGADPETVRVVQPGFVWKDRHTVHYQFTPLVGADPATFRHLDQAFYRDADHIWWGPHRLVGADVNTFRTFGNDIPYAVDERQVWAAMRPIPHVEASTFRLLHNHVYADARGVYVGVEATLVPDADAPTFRKLAELDFGGCVLFRDAARHHLYDPAHNEIHTLTPVGDAVKVTKPVWFADLDGTVRRAATVSAIWRDGELSQPVIDMDPNFERPLLPTWEVGKMQRMADAIREALGRTNAMSGSESGDADEIRAASHERGAS